MKKLFSVIFVSLIGLITYAQGNKTEVLQPPENNNQDQQVTATLKNASRLFSDKGDISSVIEVIPIGSVVKVIEADSTYYKVSYGDDSGFIFRKDAVINQVQEQQEAKPQTEQENIQQNEGQSDTRRANRFSYLEYKYGTKMAALLFAGKIWKGMSSDMVKDSWGAPLKINRVIGDVVKEEWIFKNSWLFIENDHLVEWGPVKSNQ